MISKLTLVGDDGSFWKQKVSSPLAITLLLLMVFWTGLYYAQHKATDIAHAYTSDYTAQ